jgi:glucokinase
MRIAGAVDIGGTRTKIGIVAEDGRIVRRTTIPTNIGGEPQALVDAIASTLQPMLNAQQAARIGTGISVAGFLNPDHNTMIENANLPALCGFPLRRALEERIGYDCRLEVDSNAAVLAEYRFGAGRDASRLLGVTVGTGLGGGVVIHGKLLRYTGECAGDIGHIILEPEGRRCSCGARGCLEALVCSAALAERAGTRSAREVITAAQKGEPFAVAALAHIGSYLGLGLAALAPLFAPDTIVVGGGIASAGALLLEPVREHFRARAAPAFCDNVRIVGSTFEGWEGMIGAASLVFDPIE